MAQAPDVAAQMATTAAPAAIAGIGGFVTSFAPLAMSLPAWLTILRAWPKLGPRLQPPASAGADAIMVPMKRAAAIWAMVFMVLSPIETRNHPGRAADCNVVDPSIFK